MNDPSLYARLRVIFGSGKYIFKISVPKGVNPIELVTAHATACVFVTVLDNQVFAASNGYSDISSNIISQELQS